MESAAATAEELIRLALNGWLWWQVSLPVLSPAPATLLATSCPLLFWQVSMKKPSPALPATSTVAARWG